MRDLMNVPSAIRGSTAAGPSTGNDAASQLQGARPIPVPSILADQNTSPSISTSDYTPDLHGAQIRQEVPSLLLKEAFLFSEKEKTTVLPSPKPRMEPTHRYVLDAARNLKEFSRPSLWKQSFTLIVRHMPRAYEYGEFLSLRDQPSAPHKQTLTVKQTDAIVAAVATSGTDALLPPECSNDVDRLVKGYLQWRKEKSTTTEPISVSCCMQLLKNLHRDACSANSVNDDNGMHEYLAEIVSDKSIALSEAAKLEQQSPQLALFMYKLMEHIAPGLTASLEVDSNVLHEKPEVCALLAATLQGRFEIAEALTKNGGEAAQLQQQLLEIDANQLQQLLPLLLHDHAWTAKHLSHLKEMDRHQLKHLLPLLLHDHAWTTEHLPLLKDVSGIQLQYLLPLLQHDQAWTTRHLPLLKEMGAFAMIHLLPLLQHDHAWTTRHLPLLKEMGGAQLQYLLPLLKHDQAWTAEHLPLLKEMDGHQLKHLLPLLRYDRAWTTEHLHHLRKIAEDQLYHLARFSHLKSMDISSEGFTRAANPYVREALSLHNQDMEELTKELQTHGASLSIFHPERNMEEPTRVLKTHGASRSIFHSEREIASYLTEKFKSNYQKIPNATFGVENEMFIPGITEFAASEIENELNERLGIKNKEYHYVEDNSLSTDAPFATPPIEQITSILDAPEDIQRLQSALSILNDWGAFTNHTAGVHIHTGIKQWKAADCLTTLEEKSKNRFLHQWDQDLPKQFPGKTITPYQLLFMKQFLVNMVAMQKDFYLVSKRSRYSEPNGPMSENDLDKYYENVSSARDYEELLSSTDVDVNDANARRLNVNLIAYKKHGTIEVRGFTKKNSDHMEVDPNLPVRDLIFMQEALIKVLHDTKHILLSGVSPNDPIEVRPSTGLTEIVKEYVQDVFLLEIIHALGQRNPEQRVKTMEAIVEDTDLIASETLQKIRESQAALLEGDQLAQHFLAALNRDVQWNPSFVEGNPLKRINSLRSMADAGFSDSEWTREGFEQGVERGDTRRHQFQAPVMTRQAGEFSP